MKVEKMKGSRRWLSWLPKAVLVALLGASIAVVGCKSGSDDDDDIPATKITLDQHAYPLSIASDAQKTVTLTATVEPKNSTDTVIWESSNPEVAKVDNGIVTAVGTGDQESATATIKVTAGSVSDTCVITVYKDPIVELKDVAVTIAPVGEKTFDADSEEKFTVTATVTPEKAPYGVEWHGIDDAVVGNTKNSTGNVHTLTLTGKKSGTLTIYATVGTGEDAQRSETLTLTVTKKVQDPGTVTPGDDPTDIPGVDTDTYKYTLYSEDFDDVDAEDVLSKVPGTGTVRILQSLSGHSKVFNTYLTNANSGTDKTGTITLSESGLSAGGQAVISFLLKTTQTGGGASFYKLKDTDDNTIFGLYHANSDDVFYTIGTDATITMNGSNATIVEATVTQMPAPTWGAASTDVQPGNRKTTAWMRVTATVDFTKTTDNVTLTITDDENNKTLVDGAKGTTDAKNISTFAFQLGNSIGAFAIDNIAVLGSKDDILLKKPTITSNDDTIAAAGTLTLTGSADCVKASAQDETLPVKWVWTLDEAAEGYATITNATTANPTITGTNTTIKNHDVTVTVKATAEDDETVFAIATKTITVKALESLLKDFTLELSEDSEVTSGLDAEDDAVYTLTMNAGDVATLTASASAKASTADDAEDEKITFACESTDHVTATVDSTTITLKGSVVDSESVTVTATAGDVTKSVTINVTVNDKALGSVKEIIGATTLLYGVTQSTTLTAVIEPEGIDGVAYKWEVTGTCVKIDGAANEKTVTIVNALTSEPNSAQTATVKVTATKGTVEQANEVTVTVKKPVKAEPALYEENFDDVSDVLTVAYGQYRPPILVADADDGFALCESPKANSDGGYRAAFTVNRENPTGSPYWNLDYDSLYVVEFDLLLDGLNYDAAYSYFYLYNSDMAYKTSGGKFAAGSGLTANPPCDSIMEASWVWRLTADADWVKDNTMQHYKVYVNYNKAAGASTVTVEVDGEVVEENTPVIGKGDVQGVLLEPARGTAQTIDNIEVYTFAD